MDKVAKAVMGALVATVTAVTVALGDGIFSTEDAVAVATALIGSFTLVWAIPNGVVTIAKALAGAVAAGGAAFMVVYADGAIAGNEWWYLLSALVGGLFVYQTANAAVSSADA